MLKAISVEDAEESLRAQRGANNILIDKYNKSTDREEQKRLAATLINITKRKKLALEIRKNQ